MPDVFICGTPVQQLEALGVDGLAHWARGYRVRWGVVEGIGGFSARETVDIMRAAFDSWAAVCGFLHEYSTNSRAWNVEIRQRRIDGAFGTLAEAQLPVSSQARTNPQALRLRQWYDTSERWTLAEGNTGQQIDLLRTAAHETGHTIGMGHAPSGSNNLMAPSLGLLRGPGDWGKRESLRRYGEPATSGGGDGGGDGGNGGGGNGAAACLELVEAVVDILGRSRGIRPGVEKPPTAVVEAAEFLAASKLGSTEKNNAAAILAAYFQGQ